MLEFRLPDLGEGVTEGEVVEWRVRPGATVRSDEVLVVVGTDKATVEIPSPFTGTVAALLVPEGTVVPVGTPLVRIETSAGPPGGDAPTRADPATPAVAPTPAAPQAPGARVPALPAVRRQARLAGLDLASVPGTGAGGRVRSADLPVTASAAGPAARERREPLRGARRLAAERLAAAHRHVPQVTYVLEADFGPAEAAVAAAASAAVPPTLLGYVCAATVAALRRHPVFNSRYDEATGEIVYLADIHLGVAVQATAGLLVPVLHGAGALPFGPMKAALAALVDRARQAQLSAAELAGATFTVSSGGRLGGLLATPLVNWPNVATLGVHAVADRPIVRDGQLAIGRIANLSLSFDHRVIDGMAAAAFLHELADHLGRPIDLQAALPAE